MRPNTVKQGGTFDFSFDLTGLQNTAFTVTMSVLQYPGDTPAISRTLTYGTGYDEDGNEIEGYLGTLTAAETAALAIGKWYIHVEAVDSDEELPELIPLYVEKGWV